MGKAKCVIMPNAGRSGNPTPMTLKKRFGAPQEALFLHGEPKQAQQDRQKSGGNIDFGDSLFLDARECRSATTKTANARARAR